jgi:hypothetical protein
MPVTCLACPYQSKRGTGTSTLTYNRGDLGVACTQVLVGQ